jgi:hypothetical protein
VLQVPLHKCHYSRNEKWLAAKRAGFMTEYEKKERKQ